MLQAQCFNLSFDSVNGFAAKMRDGDDLMSGIRPNIAKGYAPYFEGVIELIKQNPTLQNPSAGQRHAFASLLKAEEERKNQKR